MRKYLLLITFLTPFLGCKNEPNDDWEVLCDAIYCMNIVVKNETDREIIMTNKYLEFGIINWPHLTLAPEEKNDDIFLGIMHGSCEKTRLLTDYYMSDNDIVFGTTAGTSVFRITIDGEDITDDIWFRKYWSYTPDYHVWTYTLTVTDELLDSLPPAGDK